MTTPSQRQIHVPPDNSGVTVTSATAINMLGLSACLAGRAGCLIRFMPYRKPCFGLMLRSVTVCNVYIYLRHL